MVIVELPNGEIAETKSCFVFDIFKMFKINEDTVLVTKDGKLITPDIHLKNGDKIKLIPVVSGG